MTQNPVVAAAEGLLALLLDILTIPMLALGSLAGGRAILRHPRRRT